MWKRIPLVQAEAAYRLVRMLFEKIPTLHMDGETKMDGIGFPTTRWVGESDSTYKEWKSYGSSLRERANAGALAWTWGKIPSKFYRRHPGIVPHATWFHADSVPIVYYFMMRELGYGQEEAYKEMLKALIGGPGAVGTKNFTEPPGRFGGWVSSALAWTKGQTKVPPARTTNAGGPAPENQQASSAGDGSSLPTDTEQTQG